jgi:hypothetical protein
MSPSSMRAAMAVRIACGSTAVAAESYVRARSTVTAIGTFADLA